MPQTNPRLQQSSVKNLHSKKRFAIAALFPFLQKIPPISNRLNRFNRKTQFQTAKKNRIPARQCNHQLRLQKRNRLLHHIRQSSSLISPQPPAAANFHSLPNCRMPQQLNPRKTRDNPQPQQLQTQNFPLNRRRQFAKSPLPAQPLPALRFHKLMIIRQNPHRPQYILLHRRQIQTRQTRQQLVPNPIPQNIPAPICRIFAENQTVLCRIRSQIRLSPLQKRPNQPKIHRISRTPANPHPAQAFRPRAAQSPQKKQLQLIVRMMPQNRPSNPSLPSNSRQKPMPQLSPRHFQRNSLRLCRQTHIRPLRNKIQSQPRRNFPRQLLIRIAFLAAKPMIKMRRRQIPTAPTRQSMQNIQQNHRIQTARHRRQNRLAIQQNPLPPQKLFH